MSRTKMREQAFKLLYQTEIQKENNKQIQQLFFSNTEITDAETKKYITEIANGVEINKTSINELIVKNLKADWKIERISKVNLALLKLAVYEMIYIKEPYKMVIDESVKLARKYGDENSASFINGVLASVVKEKL